MTLSKRRGVLIRLKAELAEMRKEIKKNRKQLKDEGNIKVKGKTNRPIILCTPY